jgi:hypothetical protein
MYIVQSLLGYEFYVKPLRLAYAEEQSTFERSRSRRTDRHESGEAGGWKALTAKFKSKKVD